MEDSVHHALSGQRQPATTAGCEHCVSRRDFIARSTLAAAALAALEACGDGQIGAPTSLPDGPFIVRISDFPGLSTTGTLVDVSSVAPERAVIRTSATAFAGFSKICTHQQCTTDVRNNRFECPCHGSRFANDGSVITGPAERSLTRLNVTVNGDGTLTVG
jgi:Rieske Fe-S protein